MYDFDENNRHYSTYSREELVAKIQEMEMDKVTLLGEIMGLRDDRDEAYDNGYLSGYDDGYSSGYEDAAAERGYDD